MFNRRRKNYIKANEYNGCKIETIFTVNHKALDAIIYAFFATLKAKRMARKGSLDIIHYHAEGTCFFLNLFPKKRKFKIVVTVHGLDWKRGKRSRFASKIIRHGEKMAVKYADKIIVLSEQNKQYFMEEYGKDTTFIPNGIAKPVFKEADIIKNKYGLVHDSYVLFVARIVPEKGLNYLIEAWVSLKNQIDANMKLVIAGTDLNNGNYFRNIKKIVKNDNSIIMTGFVEGEELEELYSDCYLFVLPSLIEGMSMSLLEAISYNKICLVSDIPENIAIIDQDCVLFKAGDTLDLKNKLLNSINNRPNRSSSQHLSYSWDMVVDDTIKIYSKLMGD